jgi:shikimate dehydrogenase
VLVFDVVYNPLVTPLLAAAEKRGARTAGGLAMLVYQAAASFKLWTGLDAPEDEMLAAAEKALIDA